MPRFAFLDLDGTLVRTNLVHVALHHARRRATWTGRAASLVSLAAGAPGLAVLEKMSRTAFQDVFFRAYAGLSEDRLRWLGTHAAETILEPALRDGTRDLLARLRTSGIEPVIVTGNLAHVVAPLCDRLGLEHFGASALEMRDGVATGRLAPPAMTGAQKAVFIRRFCQEHGASLDDCHAYSDAMADLPMLAAVGHPCVVHPDRALRVEAEALQWPLLSLDRDEAPARSPRLDALIESVLSR